MCCQLCQRPMGQLGAHMTTLHPVSPQVPHALVPLPCRLTRRVPVACVSFCFCSWQQRAFVKAPLADLLLPEDIQRGYIYEPHPTASVLDWLLQAVQQWEAEGGEAQVGHTPVRVGQGDGGSHSCVYAKLQQWAAEGLQSQARAG